MKESIARKLSPEATRAIRVYAPKIAADMKHRDLDTGHLMLGVMQEESGVYPKSVSKRMENALGVSSLKFRRTIEGIDHSHLTKSSPKMSHGVEAVLKHAAKLAKNDLKIGRYNGTITRWHIAQALADRGDAMFFQILKELNITRREFAEAMEGSLPASPVLVQAT